MRRVIDSELCTGSGSGQRRPSCRLQPRLRGAFYGPWRTLMGSAFRAMQALLSGLAARNATRPGQRRSCEQKNLYGSFDAGGDDAAEFRTAIGSACRSKVKDHDTGVRL